MLHDLFRCLFTRMIFIKIEQFAQPYFSLAQQPKAIEERFA